MLISIHLLCAILLSSNCVLNASPSCSLLRKDSIPTGWHSTSLSTNTDYLIDTIVKHSGNASVKLQRGHTEKFGIGALLQSFDATSYRGKRIKVSGWVKTKDLYSAIFTLRVYDKDSLVGYGNTMKRKLEETNDWTNYYIILDIPDKSQQIDFYVILHDEGILWLDNVQIDIIAKEGKTDDLLIDTVDKKKPVFPYPMSIMPGNLGFENIQWP